MNIIYLLIYFIIPYSCEYELEIAYNNNLILYDIFLDIYYKRNFLYLILLLYLINFFNIYFIYLICLMISIIIYIFTILKWSIIIL
jgi:hypothetical protein